MLFRKLFFGVLLFTFVEQAYSTLAYAEKVDFVLLNSYKRVLQKFIRAGATIDLDLEIETYENADFTSEQLLEARNFLNLLEDNFGKINSKISYQIVEDDSWPKIAVVAAVATIAYFYPGAGSGLARSIGYYCWDQSCYDNLHEFLKETSTQRICASALWAMGSGCIFLPKWAYNKYSLWRQARVIEQSTGIPRSVISSILALLDLDVYTSVKSREESPI